MAGSSKGRQARPPLLKSGCSLSAVVFHYGHSCRVVSDAWRDCASDLDVPAMSHCVVLHGGYGMRFIPHKLQSCSLSEVATGHVHLKTQVDNEDNR